jgi:DNA-binding SARP family transcriptional activator/pimeloyl-ACP methyl ester carboxylesterase
LRLGTVGVTFGTKGLIEFRILGQLEALDDGRPLALGPSKQRALLALLLLHANQVVSRDRLIEDLWGEQAPETAATALQGYVSQLRKLLDPHAREGQARLLTRAPGYLLELDPEQLDLRRFERLARHGKRELAAGAAEAAATTLADALSLWRGPPLAEFSSAPFASAESLRLQELHVSTLEDRIEADLALARHDELIGELDALAAEHPFRERLHAQLMLALYRGGRQAEALEVYRETRHRLVDELGIEPGPALQQLQQAILRQERALDDNAARALRTGQLVPIVDMEVGDPARRLAETFESSEASEFKRVSRDVDTAAHLETHYARSGDVSIAYQVVGEGCFDVVLVPGFLSHVELGWKVPVAARTRERLGEFARLILFDKRGTGMSDRVSGAPTLETRMDDVRAVMDAARSKRAAILGVSEGAPMSLLFSATYPERTAALVLWAGLPRMMWAPDYPWGQTEEGYRQWRETSERWIFGPRREAREVVLKEGWASPDEAEDLVDYYRSSISPAAMRALWMMNSEIDVRDVLPAIRVPTLIVHGTDDQRLNVEGARFMAQRIPGARLVELPGAGHLMVGDVAVALVDQVEHFLLEVWNEGGWEELEPDRVLSTLLFTDIVGASERAMQVGDRSWRRLLDQHHALVRRELIRFRGAEIDTAGDGFFASFDGPARAIRCASAIADAVRALGIEVRIGLHTGECELVEGKAAGIAVHTGARVAAHAQPGEVLVSSTVKDLVAGSGMRFQERGEHELKGIPGVWQLYAVERSPQ